MSEVTPTELVEEITLEMDDASVVAVPVDPTLTISGEAADAYATGQAIEAVFGGAKVNDKSFTNKAVTLYASDIAMSDEAGAQTIAAAIEGIGDKDASQIMFDSENLVTVKGAIDTINTALDTELTEEEIDALFEEVFGEDEE